MKALFAPSTALMNRLSYPKKFAVVGLVVLLALSLIGFAFYNHLERVIDNSRKELHGVAAYQAVMQVVQGVQQHRGLSGGVLGGNEAMKPKRAAKEQDVSTALQQAEVKLPEVLRNGPAWAALKAGWAEIQQRGLQWTGPENFVRHTAWVGKALEFTSQIADEESLTIDPDVDTYYLIDSTINRLAPMLELMGQLRAFGTNVLATKQMSEARKLELAIIISRVKPLQNELQNSLKKTASFNPGLADSLLSASKDLAGQVDAIDALVRSDILSGQFATPAPEYFAMTTATIDSGYAKMNTLVLPKLTELIEARIASARHDVAFNLGIIVLAMLAVFYFSMGNYLSTIGSINRLAEASRVFASGDLSQRIQLEAHDELQIVSGSFNDMADAFSRLIRNVRSGADDVLGAASKMAEATDQIRRSSLQQSESASSMAAAVEEMTVGVDHVSTNAQEANALSSEAGKLSAQGTQIVETVVAEIRQIAERVNQSAAIISDLGNKSNDISAIVDVIKEIADQTNLLALNAAIEAARAGETGRGFAVVADEVRKLAERTTKSTQEISAMITAIQSGTHNAVSSMAQGVERVESGVKLASQAGEAMGQVRESAAQVVTMVSDISSSLREQSAASTEIARNVEQIAQMAEENSAAVNANVGTAGEMRQLAQSLSAEVSRFKLG